jgi:predicted ATP-dependent endonuclease of OLD family
MEDYLVFEGKFAADFCEGVNVFIGANATGKTTILKAIYGYNPLVFGSKKYKIIDSFFEKELLKKICESYLSDLKDSENNIIEYNRWGLASELAKETMEEMGILPRKNIIDSIKKYTFNYTLYYTDDKKTENVIFIPAVNIISYSKGMVAFDDKYKLPFDESMIRIIKNAQLPELKENTEWQEKLLNKLENIIDGIVVYENDTFYILKHSGKKIEFAMEALGYTKLGLLWKLIKNGLLEPGTVLLWDEPENSLNPELMSELVDILFELSRNGVQIFVTTHNEIFAKYFDINKKEKDNLIFFSLYKENNTIKYDNDESFDLLQPNILIEENALQYRKEIDKEL